MKKFKFIVAASASLSLIYLTVDSSSLGDEIAIFGPPTKFRIIVAACIVGLSTLIAILESTVVANRMRRQDWIARNVLELVVPLWAILHSLMSDGDCKKTFGVSVWLVPRWHWTLVPRTVRDKTPMSFRRKFPTPRMWRAAQMRLTPSGQASDIAWRRGVGAIGLCWLNRSPFFYDMESKWGLGTLPEAAWNDLQPQDKMRLRYSEYLHLAGRYRTVLCYPIFRDRPTTVDREFIGCIVVDTSVNAPPYNIDTPQVHSHLFLAATLIALKLERE